MQSSKAMSVKPLFWLLLSAMLLPLVLAAQPADATLSGLIGSIKAQKESALDPRRVARPQPEPLPKVLHRKTPIVWSIFGLNQAFSAVVVIEGKTHVLHSSDLPYLAAGWKVLSMDATGLQLQGHGRRLSLPAPDVGTRPEQFLSELGVNVASANALDASDTGILSQRLPLQAGQLSGLPSVQMKAPMLSGGGLPMAPNPSTGFSQAQVKASSLSREPASGPGFTRANSKTLESR
jgi:hypothetical protein